ncbi:HD domain-containing protein [Haloarchaeobius sp. HME9146]|uniref:HD domain-containing protein n=1 Tax=Haloarchaeobius sp. HME9146 TaxID=2978732 RepID=UPI0021BF02A2|nr:HD domain-containing protein [Haloarchaeobius sp. HME9146]MCT9095023.1 HD domain-containing protein [Haloarchaeobius sp. HME9146]
MHAIKDSVHDYIEVSGVVADLLDTPAMQRLRHVKQLSSVRLVYPSANHTRFEHSLGVYHLARRACRHLDIDGSRAEAVQAAALLHDVGHGPYGHQTEGIILRRLGRHHDEVHDLLGQGDLARVLESHGLDTGAIADLIDGQGKYGQLVSGELDVDRMDYLVRDAHHSGVPYGTIDQGRLLRALTFIDDDLALSEGNLATAESMLVARALMNATVYRHHVSRIAGSMLERVCERLLDETPVSVEEFARMSDDELLAALRRHDETSDVAARLATRDLYKRTVWAELDDVPDRVVDADHETRRELEAEIAEDAGVPAETVLLDVPGRPSMPESSTRVVVNGEVRRLHEESPLVQGLQAAQSVQWRLGVYTPEESVETVRDVALDVLDVPADGTRPSGSRSWPA